MFQVSARNFHDRELPLMVVRPRRSLHTGRPLSTAESSAGLTTIVAEAPFAAPSKIPFHVPANFGCAGVGLGLGVAFGFDCVSNGCVFAFFGFACSGGAGVGLSATS